MFFHSDHKNLMGMKWEGNTLIYSLPITLHSASNITLAINSKNLRDDFLIKIKTMVGAVGFEPTTPWSQTRCTTRLCYAPKLG